MKSFAGEKPKRKNTRFSVADVDKRISEAEETQHDKETVTKLNSSRAKGQSTGQFESGAAPRVGGPAKATQGGVPKGGSKKMLVRSKKNVNKSMASSQAKKSARKLY